MFIRTLALAFCSVFLLAANALAFPALYSTYLRDSFTPNAIATDAAGNIYLAGNAIVDPSSSQTTVLVVKLNPQATAYLYTRFIGGSVSDGANAIAVDSAGNVYIAGVTNSPDFPTIGGNFATPPPGGGPERSFVAKLNAAGELVFSDLLGGSASSYAQAVAVDAAGQVLVSGTSIDASFPSTPGVYSVSDTSFEPYLIELDPTGTKLLFSATGIGGNAVTLDSAGNIYMAGSTSSLTYPTTPGLYQTKFPVFQTCVGIGQFPSQGPNQYVTKLDPTGTKMIFSTAVSGTGITANEGLAVDAEGNVYLTGLAGVGYPYTVAAPTPPVAPALDILATPALPFLTKLDPAGAKLIYSVPVGGKGVQVDSNGVAYAGGVLGRLSYFEVAGQLPALAHLPAACLLGPATTSSNSAYAAQVDASGNILGEQFIGGSTVTASGVALSGATLWIAGTANLPDFPFTPNALTTGNFKPIATPGAYLGAVNFAASERPAGTPRIGCVVDAATDEPTGPIVTYQLLTIFGSGLGPAKPLAATNNTTDSLGGVTVTIGGVAAPLLYVSSNQINLAVPVVPNEFSNAVMTITVNGVSSPSLAFPLTTANPSVFSVPGSYNPSSREFAAVALNADGTVNSPSNAAKLGSAITIFVNGLAFDPQLPGGMPPQLTTGAGWSVTNVAPGGPFILDVNLQVPSTTENMECPAPNTTACAGSFEVQDISSFLDTLPLASSGGVGFSGLVYVAP